MGSLNLPVRDQTCLRLLLWLALQLMLLLRLRQMPRLMLVFCMEDMDMVLDLAMQDMDMVLELMDTQDLDIMARDPLMLNQRLNQRLRLMLDFFMEDMGMVLVWDMLVWDIVVLAMLDTDIVLDLTDTLDLDIMARDPLMLSLKPRLMLVFCMEDMDMVLVWDMLIWDIVVLDMLVLDMPDMVDMDIPIMVRLYLPFFLKQKLKVISDWQSIIQCP